MHGWMFKDFHKYCDNIGPTLTLLQVKDGDCIGGFTSESWESLCWKEKTDSCAVLFNLTTQTAFPVQKGEECGAIRCDHFSGPYFGCVELHLRY